MQNLLTLKAAVDAAAEARDKKLLSVCIKNFSRAYDRASMEEQGEYHHLFCERRDAALPEQGKVTLGPLSMPVDDFERELKAARDRRPNLTKEDAYQECLRILREASVAQRPGEPA